MAKTLEERLAELEQRVAKLEAPVVVDVAEAAEQLRLAGRRNRISAARAIVAAHDVRPRFLSLPRWCHRLWAKMRGFFWMPCPTCGDPFGGHEASGSLMVEPGRGLLVCEECEAVLKPKGLTLA